jgi:hypothetical protein
MDHERVIEAIRLMGTEVIPRLKVGSRLQGGASPAS